MTTVPRRGKAPAAKPKSKLNLEGLVESFRAWTFQREAAAASKAEADRLRDEVFMPSLIEAGVAHGEKGQHLAIELPEPVGEYTRLVRRANVSTFLNVDNAIKLLKKKGVLPEAQVVSVTITGVPGTKLEDLEAAIAKLQLEKKFGVLPDIRAEFSQDAMYAIHQRHRQELQEREANGEKIGVRERAKYLHEDELDALLESETTYSFHPEKN